MKRILSLVATASLFLPGPVAAEDEPDEPVIEAAQPKDGVYVTYGMHNIVLELEDGRFRYWFSSDAKAAPGEEITYPLEGKVSVNKGRITLEHLRLIPLTANWTFRSVDGVVTLWRMDALEMAAKEDSRFDLYALGKRNFLKTGGGSILVPTKKSAEEAWKNPQAAQLTAEEYQALLKKQAAEKEKAAAEKDKGAKDGQ